MPAEDVRGAEERLDRAGLGDLAQHRRVPGFHADDERDAPARLGRRDHLLRARRGNDAVRRIPREAQPAADHAIEERDCPRVVLEQVVVEPHHVADAELLLESLQLVEHGIDRAQPYPGAIESPHAAERAARSAAARGERGREARPWCLEVRERADDAVAGEFSDLGQLEGRYHVHGGRGRLTAVQEPVPAAHAVGEDHLPERVDPELAADDADENLNRTVRLAQEREPRGGDVVEDPLDVVGHVDAADRDRHAAAIRPRAHLAQRLVRHREHAGDADQLGLERIDRVVEMPLPYAVEVEGGRRRRGMARLQHLVVEVHDADVDAHPTELLGEHDEAIGREVRTDAAARGVEAEQAGIRVGRVHQQDAIEAAGGKLRPQEALRADEPVAGHAGVRLGRHGRMRRRSMAWRWSHTAFAEVNVKCPRCTRAGGVDAKRPPDEPYAYCVLSSTPA